MQDTPCEVLEDDSGVYKNVRANRFIINNRPLQNYDVWKFVNHLSPECGELEALQILELTSASIIERANTQGSEIAKHLKYIVFQLERGGENGHFHLQGFYTLKIHCALSWQKWLWTGVFDDKHTMFLPSKIDDVDHNRKYCTKDSTRVPGTRPQEIYLCNN